MINFKKLKFWEKQEIIEFYCKPELEGVIPEPKPAHKFLPDWFKNLSPSLENLEQRDPFGAPILTAKKCMPLLDAMSYGFIIPLCGDVRIKTNHDCTQLKIVNPETFKVCEHHNSPQVGGFHKLRKNQGDPLKFINHWGIRTAPGWSTLFIPPLNHMDMPFTCLSGLVDTDVYQREVNFPAIWHKPDADETLSAGTPLILVIPIRRGTFNNKKPKIRKMTEKDIKKYNRLQMAMESRAHVYTNELRVKK